MRTVMTLTFLVVFFLSCEDKDKNSVESNRLYGTWELKEVMVDPGDGSGTFLPVTSSRTLIFLSDSTVVSNGNMCNMNINDETYSTGTYSLADSIIQAGCNKGVINLNFGIRNGKLIVSYPCIEGCAFKYAK